MIELAVDGLYRGDFEAMHALGRARASTAARPLGDARVDRAPRSPCARSRPRSAAPQPRRRRTATEAAELIDRLSDDELARRLDALVHLATAEMYLDQFEASGRHAERALAIGRATGQGDLFPLIYPDARDGALGSGRAWPRPAEVLDGAVEAARLVGQRPRRSPGTSSTARSPRSRPATSSSRSPPRRRASTSRKNLDESIVSGRAAAVAAPRRCSRPGDAARGRRAARGVGRRRGAPDDRRRLAGVVPRAAHALLLAAGRRAEAERAAAAAAACADAVRAADGSRDGAISPRPRSTSTPASRRAPPSGALAAAAGARRGRRRRIDAALARLLAGRALAAGRRAGPGGGGARARGAPRSTPSAPPRYRAEAERELRKLGQTHPPAHARRATGDGGVASLTERELELARLVVDRKTNPQIAAELFLSQKTVETHLRNIFRKVGVASRVELARAVEQADRAESGAPH